MDSASKDQSSASVNSGRSATSRLLRYPLRSGTKSKEEKPVVADSSNSAPKTSRSVTRPTSSVSKSMGVLDLSGKEKSAKPPRRMSIPSKSSASPTSRSVGNITPISEARAKRSGGNNRMSSASYWLAQIKLSEAAAKHSISLGFFKLAFEAKCEPLQQMKDQLKLYVRRYNLFEVGEPVKELFECYKIAENSEQLQVPESTHMPEETKQADEDVHSSSSSITETEKLKPKSSDAEAEETDQVNETNKETTKKNDSVKKTRRLVNKSAANIKPASELRGRSMQRKYQVKKEPERDNDKVKKHGNKAVHGEGPPLNPTPERSLLEDKENVATLTQQT